jgi:hypothetical protein
VGGICWSYVGILVFFAVTYSPTTILATEQAPNTHIKTVSVQDGVIVQMDPQGLFSVTETTDTPKEEQIQQSTSPTPVEEAFTVGNGLGQSKATHTKEVDCNV